MNTNIIVGRTVAQIIPTIVSGLYNDKYDLVREYCQNGYDAILKRFGTKAGDKGKIEILTIGKTLTIHDNGTGMDREIVFRLAEIGYSTKDSWDQVGYRGIGRLAGICGAKTLTFITKATNEPVEHSFTIDAGSLVNSLDRETKFNEDAGELLARFSFHSEVNKSNRECYTTVVLDDIYGEAGKLLNEYYLREYLELNLPISVHPLFSKLDEVENIYKQYEKTFPNIIISLNNRMLKKPFHELGEGLKFESIELKNSRGKLLGVAWYVWYPKSSGMIVDDKLRGLRIRNRGFTIGQPRDMRNFLQTKPIQVADWFTGEVIVIDERARVSSDRSRLEDNEARAELLKVLSNVLGRRLSKIAHNVSDQATIRRTFEKGKTIKKEIEKVVNGTKYLSEQQIKKKIDEIYHLKEKIETFKYKAKKKQDIEFAQKHISGLNDALMLAHRKKQEQESVIKRCGFNQQTSNVYCLIVKTIEKYYKKASSVEDLITRIDNNLLRKFDGGGK